jgi:hypothetical protein
MILSQMCKTRSSSLGYRSITYTKPNTIIFSKFHGHPLVLCGTMTPNELTKFGIKSEENYYIITHVTHNFNEKNYPEFKKVLPNFPLEENLGNFSMTMGF